MLLKEMRELVEELNVYAHAYYMEDTSLISNYEYDKKYDRLKELEKATGIILANSPTISVGSETVSELEKVEHDHLMLSLDKTKNMDEVERFMNGLPGLAMLKMDGLTISVKYINGKLVAAETRGNGIIGENVLHTVNSFVNLPKKIPYKDEVVIDGEAIMEIHHYTHLKELKDIELKKDGERKGLFNEELEKYIKDNGIKNIRNLTAGSVRQLDSSVTKERKIKFVAWKAIRGIDGNSFMKRLQILELLGFEVVPWVKVDNIEENIKKLREVAREKDFPIDGIVFSYDDINYSESLGNTSHHVRSQLAYKFADDKFETIIRDVKWSMGKTGQLTPVAVFDPVEIDDTIVERASLHNVSIFKSYELSAGDRITVYKANMIIPQIAENLTRKGDKLFTIPDKCPICGGRIKIIGENETEEIQCMNLECKGKLLGELCTFVSKEAHDITGLSKSTLSLLIEKEFIKGPSDLFYLKDCREMLLTLQGLGAKKVDKILESIEKCRKTTLPKFLYGLSIPLIGRSVSKQLNAVEEKRAREKGLKTAFDSFIEDMDSQYDFTCLEDFGFAKASSLKNYFEENQRYITELAAEFQFEEIPQEAIKDNLNGKTFCITGTLTEFANRSALIEKIESLGGKVTGSVTKKTGYLINNDAMSKSSKNAKAVELGVPIISEKDFINKFVK